MQKLKNKDEMCKIQISVLFISIAIIFQFGFRNQNFTNALENGLVFILKLKIFKKFFFHIDF